MRKHQIAEFVLTLVTSRDRASTIVGDLAETGSLRSIEVLQVSFAFLWLHLKHAPLGNIMAVALGAVLSYAALAFVAPLLMGAMGWNRVGTDQQFLIWVVAAVLWGRIIAPFLNGYAGRSCYTRASHDSMCAARRFSES